MFIDGVLIVFGVPSLVLIFWLYGRFRYGVGFDRGQNESNARNEKRKWYEGHALGWDQCKGSVLTVIRKAKTVDEAASFIVQIKYPFPPIGN